MRKLQAIVLIGLLAAPCLVALAGERITGTYSSLRYIEEAGDLLGMEVLVVPSQRAGSPYSALVQISEGGAPALAIVDFVEKNGEVEFVIPPGGIYAGMKFTGALSKGELVLKWPSGDEEHLKRGKSYWQ
jgi:hypothetical protein